MTKLKSKRFVVFTLLMTLMIGSLYGCATPGSTGKTDPTQSDTTTADSSGTGSEAAGTSGEKTVTYAQTKDVDSFDPRNATSTITASMMNMLYSSLVTTDADFNIICDAAESYEQIDERTYKFTLKQGIKFHDGSELTSEDVKYTLDTIREEEATYKLKSDFSFMSCEPIDEYNLYIKTDEPNVSTLLRLNYVKIIPKNYVEKVGDEEFNKHPIGSGPFKFVEWNKDESIKLEAFDDYFGGKPKIDEVICKVIPEASARVAALQAGEVDIIGAVSTSQIDSLKGMSDIEVVTKPTTRAVYFTMNSFSDSPVKDLKVRQAINYAIQKDAIVAGVLDGYGTAIQTLALPMFEGYDDSIKGYEYNPEKARELLKEAGYPDGFSIELEGSFSGISNGADVAQAVGAQLAEIGIKTSIVEKDSNTMMDEYAAQTTSPLTMWSFGGPYNNINLITKCVLGTGERYSAWSDTVFDGLKEKMDTTMDETQRLEVYKEVQQYIIDMAPVVPLYQTDLICAYNKTKIKSWSPRTDEMMIMNDVELAE